MNLHDVIPLVATPKPQKLSENLRKQIRDYQGVQAILGRITSTTLDRFIADRKQEVILAAHAGQDVSDVPEELGGVIAQKIQRSPRVALESVLRIMDDLGFALIPVPYLHSGAFGEDHWARTTVGAFQRELEPLGYKVAALAPAHYYSPRQHLQAKNLDLAIYGGGSSAATLASVSTLIPLLRYVQRQVDALGNRIADLDSRVGSLEARMTEAEHRISALEREAIRAAKERASVQTELATLQESRLRAWEPMALAYLGSPMDAGNMALVGPCWGPDFHDAILPALGWELIRGQRADLKTAVTVWQPPGRLCW